MIVWGMMRRRATNLQAVRTAASPAITVAIVVGALAFSRASSPFEQAPARGSGPQVSRDDGYRAVAGRLEGGRHRP